MDSAAEDLNPIGSVYSLLPEVQICLARDLRDLARHSLCGPAEHSGDSPATKLLLFWSRKSDTSTTTRLDMRRVDSKRGEADVVYLDSLDNTCDQYAQSCSPSPA